jgi:hypothetical protein
MIKKCEKWGRQTIVNSRDGASFEIYVCDEHLEDVIKKFTKIDNKIMEEIKKELKQHPYNPELCG